ncbi:hypothetical protein RJ639_037346 [Escallonia herrerae]|uniref:RNase H type-1 domain-containing protein n=1 Tax=Escallonia herrerae TaxID=1293975 RepID=A0AA89BD78_9ASTE|nr:hypothetical protein RJ639_037346 [Escallonia herrerae]
MGSWAWAVKVNITDAVKRTSNTNFPRRASLTLLATASKHLHVLHFSSCSPHKTHNHGNLVFPIKRFSFMPKSCHALLHNSAHYPTVLQPFDESPQRKQNLETVQFYYVIDLIKFSAVRSDILTAVMTHSLALKVGALAHLPTSTSLLTIYSRAGDFSSSKALFGEIYAKDVVLWNAMITAAIDNQYCLDAMSFFNEMIKEGKGFDSATLVIVISALSKMKKLPQCRSLHGLSLKSGLLSGSFLCNALIDMYAKCGDLSSSECMFGGMDCRDLVSWNSVMSGCLYNQSPYKSLCYFKQMACCKEQADYVSLSCAISASACLRELCIGQIIHGLGIKLGYQEFPMSVSNSLLSLYSQCGDIDAAENLFSGMVWKDVISWNAMIDGFVFNGKVREAFDLLHYMQTSRSVQPDIVTVVTIIPLCAEFVLLREGKSVHGFTIRREAGLELSRVSLVADTDCWNTIISGCTQNGFFLEALEAFDFMRRKSHVTPDSVTITNVVSACGNLEFGWEGKVFHGIALKTLLDKDTRVQNALITMYGRLGDTESATSVFSFCSSRNLCSWNCMISALSQNKDPKRALELFSCIDFEPNEVTIATILSACTQLGAIRHGKQIHGLVFRSGFHTNSFITAALLDMYSNCGRLDIAIRLFQFLPEKSVAAWNSMISAYGFHSNGLKAVEVFNQMIDSGIQLGCISHPRPGVAQYALQVDAAWKPNDIEAGIAVVILQNGIQVNTWKGRRMASYAQHAEALAILEAVKWARNNANPNIISHTHCSSFIRKLILAGEDNSKLAPIMFDIKKTCYGLEFLFVSDPGLIETVDTSNQALHTKVAKEYNTILGQQLH